VVVALAMTIVAGIWLAGRVQRLPPTTGVDSVGAGDPDAASPTQVTAFPSPSDEGAPIQQADIDRHTLTVGGVPVSFAVPSTGWEYFGGISLNKSILGSQGAEAMLFWSSFPEGDRVDPCPNLLNSSIGFSAADLASAVATAPGTGLVSISDVTVGGRPAKRVILTVRKANGCDPGFFYTWKDFRGGALFPRTTVGDTIEAWIVDVRGTHLFFSAVTTEQANYALEREIRRIVGSIRFHPPRAFADLKVAERFMRARDDHDIATAMSLLAKDGATARMQHGYRTDPRMPVVRMDREELTLALEAERLYGVRYASRECRWEPDAVVREAPIVCGYRMDNTLRQILEYPPVTSSVSIGVREGRVTHLGFPWLNVSYPGATPPELAEFVAWLGTEHPEAGQVYEEAGELFRTGGQELVHILTGRSVDLLATYLEEYERALSS